MNEYTAEVEAWLDITAADMHEVSEAERARRVDMIRSIGEVG